MKNISTAFVKAKRNFGAVLKDKTNPAFKSKYANLEACLDAVDEACLDQGIALYQETFDDATGVTVETVFLHESGEQLRCGKLHVPAAKQDPQGYGSALTYARRYSLLAACGIAAEDDDGNAASRKPEVTHAPAPAPDKPKPVTLTKQQANEVRALVEKVGIDESLLLTWIAGRADHPVDTIEQIPVEAFEPVIANLKNRAA